MAADGCRLNGGNASTVPREDEAGAGTAKPFHCGGAQLDAAHGPTSATAADSKSTGEADNGKPANGDPQEPQV